MKYNSEQVLEKLKTTKWPSTQQLLNFYEQNRDVFNFKQTEQETQVQKIAYLFSDLLTRLKSISK